MAGSTHSAVRPEAPTPGMKLTGPTSRSLQTLQVARVAGNIHFAVRPEALFLSKNADEIKEVRRLGCRVGWQGQTAALGPFVVAEPALMSCAAGSSACACKRPPCPLLFHPAGPAAAASAAPRHGRRGGCCRSAGAAVIHGLHYCMGAAAMQGQASTCCTARAAAQRHSNSQLPLHAPTRTPNCSTPLPCA